MEKISGEFIKTQELIKTRIELSITIKSIASQKNLRNFAVNKKEYF